MAEANSPERDFVYENGLKRAFSLLSESDGADDCEGFHGMRFRMGDIEGLLSVSRHNEKELIRHRMVATFDAPQGAFPFCSHCAVEYAKANMTNPRSHTSRLLTKPEDFKIKLEATTVASNVVREDGDVFVCPYCNEARRVGEVVLDIDVRAKTLRWRPNQKSLLCFRMLPEFLSLVNFLFTSKVLRMRTFFSNREGCLIGPWRSSTGCLPARRPS